MKIKTKDMAYERVMELPRPRRALPLRPNIFFKTLLKLVSASDLKDVHFQYRETGMEKLQKNEPCLFLMNHSSFIDLKIAATVLYPRPFNIVCTSDGFVGKSWLMRRLGCIPTQKFVTDLALVKDLKYAVGKLKDSILLFPEASYTFDGTATPLPESVGKLIKLLNVPVVMIRTYGAFLRDPLYNGLQNRKVTVTAELTYLLSREDCRQKTPGEINDVLKGCFTFDNFRLQAERGVRVCEGFRADGLSRVLYKCPHCQAEGKMHSAGTRIACGGCGKEYELTELGEMRALTGDTEFPHIPDWYAWERACVRRELMEGVYRLDVPVDIRMLVDQKCVYSVGGGRLVHDRAGFRLTGCDGKLEYRQAPGASYSLYADYLWYEIGDVICIGDVDTLYYCFPKGDGDVVAKTRLATEELYKLEKTDKGEG